MRALLRDPSNYFFFVDIARNEYRRLTALEYVKEEKITGWSGA